MNNNNYIVSKLNLYAWIVPYVKCMLDGEGKRCVGKFTIRHPENSLLFPQDDQQNDTFILEIPYAGNKLRWKVLFDGLSKNSRPDFILPDDFNPDIDKIDHLRDWSSNNDELLIVVQDMIKLYFDSQLNEVRLLNSNLHLQIQELTESCQFKAIEVMKERSYDIQYSVPEIKVKLLLQLAVDFQVIPDIHYKDAPMLDRTFMYPVLLFTISESFDQIVPSLYMSKRMEYVLGGQNALPLPQYTPGAITLLEYTQAVVRNLQKMIQILVEGHVKRREYVAAVLCQFEGNVLEYDSENFSKVSLLFSHQDFYFTVHVSLGRFFTHDQPKVVIQSVYHTTKQEIPFHQRFTSYPYSPRWSGQEMVKRLRAFLIETADSFKEKSLKNGLL